MNWKKSIVKASKNCSSAQREFSVELSMLSVAQTPALTHKKDARRKCADSSPVAVAISRILLCFMWQQQCTYKRVCWNVCACVALLCQRIYCVCLYIDCNVIGFGFCWQNIEMQLHPLFIAAKRSHFTRLFDALRSDMPILTDQQQQHPPYRQC